MSSFFKTLYGVGFHHKDQIGYPVTLQSMHKKRRKLLIKSIIFPLCGDNGNKMRLLWEEFI